MDLIMDGLLMAGTLFAGVYCWVLGRRVQDLKQLDAGLGGAIVTLTRQIELARATLEEAQAGAKANRAELERLVAQAETVSGRLKLMMAATRDPDPEPRPRAEAGPPRRTVLSAPPRQKPLSALLSEEFEPQPPRAAAPEPRQSETRPAAAQPLDPFSAEPSGQGDAEMPQSAPPDASTPRVWPALRRAPEAAEPDEADPRRDVPKPRLHLAPGGVLRRPVAKVRPTSENELMDALSALAAGTGR